MSIAYGGGFTSFEGNAICWTICHDQGTTYIYALNESVALMRFMAKYPNCKVEDIKKFIKN